MDKKAWKTTRRDKETKENIIIHEASKSISSLIKEEKNEMDEVERIEKKLKIPVEVITEFWEYYD